MSQINPAFIFWQHDVAQTIPNALWTPLLLSQNRVSRPSRRQWTDGKISTVAGSTNIAVGSNGQALPQGTINVDSTATFLGAGYLSVRIAGTDRVVQYTSKNATQFLGATLGVGTMTTGDLVRQGVVTFKTPWPAITAATAEVAWVGNITGRRGIRHNFGAGLVGGTTLVPSVVAAQVHVQSTEQNAFGLGDAGDFIEVFQDSTGNLDTVLNILGAPRLVCVTLGSYTPEPIV